MKFKIIHGGVSDQGRVRSNNEDCYFIERGTSIDPIGLSQEYVIAIVADGMGGENSGEVASKIAVDHSAKFIKDALEYQNKNSNLKEILKSSILHAHHSIISQSLKDADNVGMGTTLTVALFYDNEMYCAWSGDSRIYIFLPYAKSIQKYTGIDKLGIITHDHSIAWSHMVKSNGNLTDIEKNPQSHIITQSLGSINNTPNPDVARIKLVGNEKILLCTDGLNLHASPTEIEEILNQSETPQVLAEKLIDIANENGGKDNVTAAILQINTPYDATIYMPSEQVRSIGFWNIFDNIKTRLALILGFFILIFLFYISSGRVVNPNIISGLDGTLSIGDLDLNASTIQLDSTIGNSNYPDSQIVTDQILSSKLSIDKTLNSKSKINNNISADTNTNNTKNQKMKLDGIIVDDSLVPVDKLKNKIKIEEKKSKSSNTNDVVDGIRYNISEFRRIRASVSSILTDSISSDKFELITSILMNADQYITVNDKDLNLLNQGKPLEAEELFNRTNNLRKKLEDQYIKLKLTK